MISDLNKLGRVKAPDGFEQKVMADLVLRKRRKVKARHLRMSMVGAVSGLAVVVIALNLFVLPPKSTVDLSNLEKKLEGFVPITETVNYSREIRSMRQDPPTVYILEQVSNRTDAKIKY